MSHTRATLIKISTLHFFIDFACALTLVGALSPTAQGWWAVQLVLLYDCLAFALQPAFGWLADRFRGDWARLGCACVAVGCALAFVPGFLPLSVLSLACIGVGNALFHVGGGQEALRIAREHATELGIFVAPGAIGLALGIALAGAPAAWGSAARCALIVLFGVAALRHRFISRKEEAERPGIRKRPRAPGQHGAQTAQPLARRGAATIDTRGFPYTAALPPARLFAVLAFALFSVFARSYVGFAVVFPWKTGVLPAILLALAAALGKGLGGWVADRVGFTRAACSALLLSFPLLLWGTGSAALSLLAMLLFNMTMPVTLAVCARALPGLPGFAFGAVAAMLFPGMLLAVRAPAPVWAVPLLVLLSALALWRSNRALQETKQTFAAQAAIE